MSDPIIRYKFDTSLIVTDSGLSGLDLTNTNVTSVTDSERGVVAYFSGSSYLVLDSADVPTDILGSLPRTYSFWVNHSIAGSANKSMIHKNGSDSAGNRFDTRFDTNDKIGISVSYTDTYGTTILTSGVWYHLVTRYDGTTMESFINGVSNTTISASVDTSAGDFNIGANVGSTLDKYKGMMSDFRVYDYALTDAEVLALLTEVESDSSTLDVEMYSKAVHLSWEEDTGASLYNVYISQDSGDLELVKTTSENEAKFYDLTSGSSYDFVVYTDTDSDNIYSESYGNTAPAVTSETTGELIEFLGNDLTLVDTSTINEIDEYIRDNVSTEDQIKARLSSNQVETMTFVQDGETVGTDQGILTPFLLGGAVSQSINLTLSDETTENVTYDESTGSITVDDVEYSVGDKFVLDGKLASVYELD